MDAELKVNRLNTTAFIASRKSKIVLTPRERVKANGGWKYQEKAPRAEQTFRIIELGMNATPPILNLTDGKQREAEFWLLGEWDAAVEIDDIWTAEDGRVWQVGDIVRSNEYEVRALVTERGK